MRALLLVALACLFLVGCNLYINQDQDNNQITGATGGPSPSPSPDGLIESVIVNEISESCPSGLSSAPADGEVRVGCSATITCTPRLPGGDDAPPEVHGPRPDFFDITGGFALVNGGSLGSTSNPYNRILRAQGAGTVPVSCVVKGVESDGASFLLVP